MTIANRIFLLILITTSLSTLANFLLTQQQSIRLHRDSEKILAHTLVQSLREALIQDIINNNQLRVSNLLRSLKRHDNPIEYLYVTKGINNAVFAHSFEQGFPRFLLRPQNTIKKQTGVHLEHKYQTENGLVYDYSEILLTGLDFRLHIGINQTKILKQLSKNNQYIVTTSIFISIFVLLIAFLLGRQVSKPLTQLVHQIQSYGKGKVINFTGLNNSTPEIHQLSTAFQSALVEQQQAESALISSESRMKGLINTLPDLVWLKDKDGVYLACNSKVESLYGVKEDKILGKTDYDFVSKELADFFRKNDLAAEALGRPRTNEERITYASDGHEECVETIKAPMYEINGDFIGVLGIGRDISERKQAEDALTKQHKYLQSILNGIYDPIMVINEDYTVQLMNNTLRETMKSNDIADPEQPKCYEVSHHRSTPCDRDDHPCPLKRVLENKTHSVVVHEHYFLDGSKHFLELSVTPLLDNEKNCIGIIESARDITAHLEVQDKLRQQKSFLDYQAHHDTLTRLPNRLLFNDRLEQAIEKSNRNKTKMALFFIDLDHFKEINDSLGHKTGDEVLTVVTQRLIDVIRKEDTLARLGGDEFTIIMEELTHGQDASLLAQKILEVLAKPINIKNNVLYVSSSIGISLYPDDKGGAQELLKYADAAMYKAKNEGRNNFQYYSAEMTELAFERVVMESNLRTALKNEEFVVYYQPQLNGETNKLIGMEALIRWQHMTMGLVSPAKFISLAETTGLIIELDQFVMKTAMKQMTQWYAQGLNPGRLALNLAIKKLQQKDFIKILINLLKVTECQPEWLEFEVTEGQVMTNPEEAIKILSQISDLGIELSIDDFGTGYSSLSYLKRLPVNKLKIDQSFIRFLPDDEEDIAIAKAIIALSQSLNLRIIAEGVETKEQKEFLITNGCKNMQGYYYSRPIAANEMEEYLKKL